MLNINTLIAISSAVLAPDEAFFEAAAEAPAIALCTWLLATEIADTAETYSEILVSKLSIDVAAWFAEEEASKPFALLHLLEILLTMLSFAMLLLRPESFEKVD